MIASKPIDAAVVAAVDPSKFANKEYKVMCQIGQAVALPSKSNYSINLNIGGHDIVFEPKEKRDPANYKRYDKLGPIEMKLPYE